MISRLIFSLILFASISSWASIDLCPNFKHTVPGYDEAGTLLHRCVVEGKVSGQGTITKFGVANKELANGRLSFRYVYEGSLYKGEVLIDAEISDQGGTSKFADEAVGACALDAQGNKSFTLQGPDYKVETSESATTMTSVIYDSNNQLAGKYICALGLLTY